MAESGVADLLAWLAQQRGPAAPPLLVDAGCAEAASAEAEVVCASEEGIASALSPGLAIRFGVLEPLSTVVLSSLVRPVAAAPAGEGKDGEGSDGKEGGDAGAAGGDGAAPSPPWVALAATAHKNGDVSAALLAAATHVGVGCAAAPDGRIAVVINLLERRAHVTSVDGVVGGGSSILALSAADLLRGARRQVRLAVLPDVAGAGVGGAPTITGARILAALPMEVVGDAAGVVDLDVPAETKAASGLVRAQAVLRTRDGATAGERVVREIQPYELGLDDEGCSVLDVHLAELYCAPESSAGRYVVDLFVSVPPAAAAAATAPAAPAAAAAPAAEDAAAPAEGAAPADSAAAGAEGGGEGESKEEGGKEAEAGEGAAAPPAAEDAAPADAPAAAAPSAEASPEAGDAAAPAEAAAPAGPAVLFATRFVVVISDHDATGASASLESAALPSAVVAGPFSELAIGLGNPTDLPEGFVPRVMQVTISAAALVRRLPLIACGAATAGLPPVSHLLLVAGLTEGHAQENIPPGYEAVPFNIAQELAAMMGALPLSDGAHKNVGGAAAAAVDAGASVDTSVAEADAAAAAQTGSVVDGSLDAGSSLAEGGDGGGGGDSDNLPPLDVDPPFVYLAVLRDGGSASCQHMALTAVAGLPGITDLPLVEAPEGYTTQLVDIAVRTPGADHMPSSLLPGADEEAVDAGDMALAAAEPVRRTVRIVLAQTSDAAVAGAASFGSGLVIGSSAGDDWGSGASQGIGGESEEMSAYDAEAAAAAAAAAYEADRTELLEAVAAAAAEHEASHREGIVLQRQLATHFFMRLSEEERDRVIAAGALPKPAAGPGAAFAAADRDKKYRESLNAVATERARTAEEQDRYADQAVGLQAELDEKEAKLGAVARAFAGFKHEVARGSAHSHTGKPLPPGVLEKYEEEEAAKVQEVGAAQLKNIYAAAQVKKLEALLSKREQLGDGLALIDFEQLKIENTTLVEKIEDRNDELAKLRKKTTAAVQVLTHVREKLHFVSAEMGRLTQELSGVELAVSEQRAKLARGKKERDVTRAEGEKARQAQGFAYNDRLAIDYEVRKRTVRTTSVWGRSSTYARCRRPGPHARPLTLPSSSPPLFSSRLAGPPAQGGALEPAGILRQPPAAGLDRHPAARGGLGGARGEEVNGERLDPRQTKHSFADASTQLRSERAYTRPSVRVDPPLALCRKPRRR
jgi:hypothetical protein